MTFTKTVWYFTEFIFAIYKKAKNFNNKVRWK